MCHNSYIDKFMYSISHMQNYLTKNIQFIKKKSLIYYAYACETHFRSKSSYMKHSPIIIWKVMKNDSFFYFSIRRSMQDNLFVENYVKNSK